MKRKATALVLAVTLCLTLLSACKANDTPKDEPISSSQSVSTPAEQPPKEEQPPQEPPQEEPKEDEPEEPAQPTQEEPKEEATAGTALIALLQEERNNGFVEGEGPRRTYFDLEDFSGKQALIYNGVVYIHNITTETGEKYREFSSYDITSKELRDAVSPDMSSYFPSRCSFLDGNFYYMNFAEETRMYDCNGTLLNSFQQPYELQSQPVKKLPHIR